MQKESMQKESTHKESIKNRILEIGIIPVVRASSADEAMTAVHAIRLGGIPIAEITMTVPGAIETIRKVAKTFGDEILVGAGTVLDAETARRTVASYVTSLPSSTGSPNDRVERAWRRTKMHQCGEANHNE